MTVRWKKKRGGGENRTFRRNFKKVLPKVQKAWNAEFGEIEQMVTYAGRLGSLSGLRHCAEHVTQGLSIHCRGHVCTCCVYTVDMTCKLPTSYQLCINYKNHQELCGPATVVRCGPSAPLG